MPISDDQIDAILGQNDNLIEVAMRLQERKRKLAHAKAKAAQPALGIRATAAHAELRDKLKAAWDAPITDAEKSAAQGDIEYLILTVQDCVDAGDVEDLIFASMRLSRKLLARNAHLWRAQDLPKPEVKA
jgi:hypothetical protein